MRPVQVKVQRPTEQGVNKCPTTVSLLSTCLSFSLSNLTSPAGVTELKCSAFPNTVNLTHVHCEERLCSLLQMEVCCKHHRPTEHRCEWSPISSLLRPGSHCVSHPGEGRHASLAKRSKEAPWSTQHPHHTIRVHSRGLRTVIPGSCSNAQKLQDVGALRTTLYSEIL